MHNLSLKAGLSWLIAFALLAMLAVNVAILVFHAGPRVRDEADNTERLARELIIAELAGLQESVDPLPDLRRSFDNRERFRHIQVQFLSRNESYPVIVAQSAVDQRSDIPKWFVSFVAPSPRVSVIPAVIRGVRYGDIVIASYPVDEVAEIWSDVVSLATASLIATLIFMVIVLLLVRRSLAPLDALALGLARLERGESNVRLALKGAREFGDIATRLNSLGRTLDRVRGENQDLLQRLVRVQDDERRGIARDLHDEAGPCLFAIRAGVSTLVETMSGEKLDLSLAGKALAEIQKAGEALQDVVRRMLDQLRPPGLSELGLQAALQSLVVNWRGMRDDLDLSLECSDGLEPLDEAVALTAYRVVQEALTNIYRHSEADWARVSVARKGGMTEEGEERGDVLDIVIEDNGVGFSGEGGAKGRGLLGMTERVKALDGRISLDERPDGGARIEARLPLGSRENLV